MLEVIRCCFTGSRLGWNPLKIVLIVFTEVWPGQREAHWVLAGGGLHPSLKETNYSNDTVLEC